MVQHKPGIATGVVDCVIIDAAMLTNGIEPREQPGVFGMAVGGLLYADTTHELLQAPVTLHKPDVPVPQSPQLVDIYFFLIHLRPR